MAGLAPVNASHFNTKAKLPYGLKIDHVRDSMNSFLDFLGFINDQLSTKKIQPLEAMLMPPNFSSIVGEFVSSAIPDIAKVLQKISITTGTRTSCRRADTKIMQANMDTTELK